MPTEIPTITTVTGQSARPQPAVQATATAAVTLTVQRQDAAASGQALPPGAAQAEESNSGVQQAELSQAVSDINTYVQTVNRELHFSVDEALPLGRAVIKVIDAESEEVIREIPSKEVLAIAHRLSELNKEQGRQDHIKGLIFEAQA